MEDGDKESEVKQEEFNAEVEAERFKRLMEEGRELERAVRDYCRKLKNIEVIAEDDVQTVPEFQARSYAGEAVHLMEKMAGRIWAVTGPGRPAGHLVTLEDNDNDRRVNA